MSREFLLLCTSKSIKKDFVVHGLFFNYISKKILRFNILFLDNLLIFKKKIKKIEIEKEFLPKNSNLIFPRNLNDFEKKIKKNTYIAFNSIGKYFNFFLIHYLLRKKNIISFSLSNIGFIPDNKNFLEYNSLYFIKDFVNRRLVFFLFKIFYLIGFFKRIDVRFVSSKRIIFFSKKSLVGKINKLFKKNIFDYYKKYISVNSRTYDFYKINHKLRFSKRYIVFVDTPLEHPTKVEYEGRFNLRYIDDYYRKLNNFLFYLKKNLKKDLIICVHPNSSFLETKKYFPNFRCVKYKTESYVRNAYLYVGFSSSIVVDAIYLNKKILILDSDLMGKHHQFTNNIYANALRISKFNFDQPFFPSKKSLLKLINNNYKRKKFIQQRLHVDKNTLGVEKIYKYLKKNYLLI